METYYLENAEALDAQTTVNTIYYFTKMQKGSRKFQIAIEEALLKHSLDLS